MNALRKSFGSSKSHPAISALIVKEMSLWMAEEKALDIRNLTQQYGPKLLGKCPYECLKKKLWTFEISPNNIIPNC